jgi:4-amino-4-deoxy-L-arabinose transferase-like glycosyltransferase
LLVIVLRVLSFFIFIPKIWRWWPERKRDDLGWYLLTQALVVFAVFSLVKTKLPHYTMPAFPCLALWLARQISAEEKSFAWFQKRFLAMAVFILAMMLIGFSVARNYLLTENLWRAAQPHVRPETKIACLGYTEPSVVWKFRSVSTKLVLLGEVKLAKDFLTNAPPFILVLPTKDAAQLAEPGDLRLPVHGLDMVKFKDSPVRRAVAGTEIQIPFPQIFSAHNAGWPAQATVRISSAARRDARQIPARADSKDDATRAGVRA